jgi:hypothetical protein
MFIPNIFLVVCGQVVLVAIFFPLSKRGSAFPNLTLAFSSSFCLYASMELVKVDIGFQFFILLIHASMELVKVDIGFQFFILLIHASMELVELAYGSFTCLLDIVKLIFQKNVT